MRNWSKEFNALPDDVRKIGAAMEAQIVELIRCGVRLDAGLEALTMFV